MVVAAWIALVGVGVVFLLGSLRHRTFFIKKLMLIVAAAAVGILYFNGVLTKPDPTQVQAAYYNEIAPSLADAPYVVKTPSRVYYIAASYTGEDGSPVLTRYYYYDQKKWERSDVDLPLYKKLYGELEIKRR